MCRKLGKKLSEAQSLGAIIKRIVGSWGEARSPEEIAAWKAERAARELRELAETRGVPLAADVLDVALSPSCTGPVVATVEQAVAWTGQRQGRLAVRPACVVLVGIPGIGKTVALTRAVLKHVHPAYYTTAERLCALREYEARELWHRARTVDLLALDELGTEGTPEAITRLLLDRWTRGAITLCASNVSAKELHTRYFSTADGERLADRLRGQTEQGVKGVVSLRGSSRRHKGAGKAGAQ